MIKLTIISFIFSFHLLAKAETLLFAEKGQRHQEIVKKLKIEKDSDQDIFQIKRTMEASGKYKFVEFDTIEYEAQEHVDDDFIDLAGGWHHGAINTQPAWSLIDQPHDIVVAVCDSGIEANHKDLQGTIISGRNFSGSDIFDTSANTNHGTMVAGLITARFNSLQKTSGIAPQVKVMPLKIASRTGGTSMSKIIECIKYGADHGAKVINVSFTGVQYYSVQEAGFYAASKGALLVYAGGNQGRKQNWPDHENVLIVGGINQENLKWSGSNYGKFIDLVAPAKSILTTRAYKTFGGDTYSSPNGTSFSAPIVSAAAALIYSINPYFSAQEVEEILKKSANDLGNNNTYGEGLIDAKKAVSLALFKSLVD